MKHPMRITYGEKEPRTRLLEGEVADTFFDVAKEIVPPLLEEKRNQRRKLAEIIRSKLVLIKQESSDDFYRWFWRKWLILTDGKKLDTIDRHIFRLARLLRHISGKTSNLYGVNNDLIESAREVPIENVLNGPFRRSGKTLKALCPFHQERTPSFVIYTQNNHAHCFGCGIKGGVIDMYMLLNSCTFREAIFALSGSNR
jgi:hypothetical protein